MGKHRRRWMFAVFVSLAAAASGCAGAPPKEAEPLPPAAKPADTTPAAPAAPPGQVARRQVEDVLTHGPPWLLRRVPIEEVVRAGAFIGWKILALPDAWRDIELKPGDVVMKVNGATLERPDDLFDVWRALVTAKEIRIDYEREGSARQLVVPIAGEPSQELVKAFEKGGPQPKRQATRKRGVTVIEEDYGTPPEQP